MARIDDLIGQIDNSKLQEEFELALAEFRRKQKFGLVFEEHIPETSALYGFQVQPNSLVQKRNDPQAKMLYRVVDVSADGFADIQPVGDGAQEKAPLNDLLVVKQFGDPIYPTLTPLGSCRHADTNKPSHAVINGENFHTLQLLTYLFEQQVDCIYLDPPYNTGSKDWKYNNRYVDSNDTWRHSKWLSFMEKRLRLAKKLLKPDGVMIVTIDEHEVHHLGMLLEKLFPEAVRQMVTIVVNPKGVTQERFSRVDEYAFFCFWGDSTVFGRGDDLLTPGVGDEDDLEDTDEIRRPRWKGLLRSGNNARRQDRKKMFYPVLIDPQRMAVVGAGEPLPFEAEPDFEQLIDGYVPVWPIRKDGTQGRWSVGSSTLRQLISKGYVVLGGYDSKRKTWAVSYLSQELQQQIASGIIEIVGNDEVRNVVDVQYTSVSSRRIKTVWHRSRHDAGVGGTDMLRTLLGNRAFSFPKSVYAVYDCLAAVVRDRKDALILDFFAGSGTTLHATALLNDSDGGSRRCILVTNNELEGEIADQLNKRGLFRGDAEYEAHGIFESVTRPRCEAFVTGRRGDESAVPGTYLNGRPIGQGLPENIEFYRLDYLDPDDIDLGIRFDALLPSLWLAAGGIGEREEASEEMAYSLPSGSTYAVLFKPTNFRQFRELLLERPDITHAWLVTDSEEAFAEMRSEMPAHMRVSMLYVDYLRNFRNKTDRNI